MKQGSTMTKDSTTPLERRIARAKSQLTKATPQGSAAAASKPSRNAGIAGAVVSMDDDTRKELEAALGTKNISFNTNLFVRTSRTAFVFQGDDIHAGAEDTLNQTATLVSIKAFKPTDPVEAMIAAQAVMLHNLAMETGRRSQLPNQNPDVASRMRRDAANLSRSMIDMTEALERRRGKGPQVIRVEKMMIADGGQAVVGNVTTSSQLASPRPAVPALEQGEVPMEDVVEAKQVLAVDAGGREGA